MKSKEGSIKLSTFLQELIAENKFGAPYHTIKGVDEPQTQIKVGERNINCLVSNVEFNSRIVQLFLFIDITKVQESEKQKLEIKFKNIFLSSMSHNLKTPLNSLIINNEILETQLKNKSTLAYEIMSTDR